MAQVKPVSGVENDLLRALAPEDLAAVMKDLTLCVMAPREVIYQSSGVIDSVFFVESGMISLVPNLDDGTQAEVGIIGREGMLGTTLLSEASTSFAEAMVQMPGRAWRMAATDFRRHINDFLPLRALLLRYNEGLMSQIMQTAACNGRHGLEQRLARWLLLAADRADGGELPLTQEFMAMMLGVQRPSITVTAGILQRAGFIRYASGRVTVLDRASLEAASCECYGAVQRRFAALLSH